MSTEQPQIYQQIIKSVLKIPKQLFNSPLRPPHIPFRTISTIWDGMRSVDSQTVVMLSCRGVDRGDT